MTGRTHVVGAGLAGLACALALARAGRPVTLWEAAPRAGGRCRTFHDPVLDRVLDNGPHLVVGANRAVRAHARAIGGRLEPLDAAYPLRHADGTTRTVRPGVRHLAAGGRRDLAPLWRLLRAPPGAVVADCVGAAALARLWEPLCLAVLNTPPAAASARLLGRTAAVLLAGGGYAARPWVAPDGLDAALVAPAVTDLERAGAHVHFGQRITGLATTDGRVTALHARNNTCVSVGRNESVVLALPADAARALWPTVPAFHQRAIVAAHFRDAAGAAAMPPLLGLTGATGQWLFRRGDVVSVVVSAAGADLVAAPAADVAARLWTDAANALGRAATPLPPCRVVKERRATPDQTPAFATTRPGPRTTCANLFLAGDWTATGLPATLDGAVRSGWHAARLVRRNRP